MDWKRDLVLKEDAQVSASLIDPVISTIEMASAPAPSKRSIVEQSVGQSPSKKAKILSGAHVEPGIKVRELFPQHSDPQSETPGYFRVKAFPGPILKLTPKDKVKFSESVITSEDSDYLQSSSSSLNDRAIRVGDRAVESFLMISNFIREVRNNSVQRSELHAALQDKDKLLAEIEQLKKRLSESEKSREKQLAVSNEIFENLKLAVAEEEKRIREESIAEGMELCKRQLMLSDVGQSFLNKLHEGWYAAYLKSSKYLIDLNKHILHFYSYGFDSAKSQALGFEGPWDKEGPLKDLTPPPAFEGNPAEPITQAWWLPAMQESFTQLMLAPLDLKPSANPYFQLQVTEASDSQTLGFKPQNQINS